MGETRSRLYLDNAATTFPKPRSVHEAMSRYATAIGASPGRGSYAESVEGGAIIARCRRRIAELFNAESAEHVVFTLNTSDALNLAIKGLVGRRQRRLVERFGRGAEGPVHVVTTSMDHNSVLRPLNALASDVLGPRVEWTCVPADPVSGLVRAEDLRRAIRPETALVAAVHASNVTGVLQPVEAFGAVCREAGVPLLVDAAQTAGRVPIDMRAASIDLLAFPGHKGLLGPLGTGGLVLRPGMERQIDSVREGGTGSVSERDVQPAEMPDKYEPGSHNTVGLAGLLAGVEWVLERGARRVFEEEQSLVALTLASLLGGGERVRLSDGSLGLGPAFPGLRLLGLGPSADTDVGGGGRGASPRVGVFSYVHESLGAAELAAILESEYGVLTRAGIHCAPRAHETFGTLRAGGAVRMSYGPFVTPQDVRYALDALSRVCTEVAGAV